MTPDKSVRATRDDVAAFKARQTRVPPTAKGRSVIDDEEGPLDSDKYSTAPPRRIVVGPLRYTVVLDDGRILERSRDEQTDLLGHHDPRALTITVRPDMADDAVAETIVHELLHALISMTGAQQMFEHNGEEDLVNRLSAPLLDLLRRNPALVDYLTAADDDR